MSLLLRVISIRFLLCAATAPLLVGAAAAQEPTHKVRMYWNFGSIDVELYGNHSPRHVANFFQYANAGDYNSTYVHRSQSGSAQFVQGGGFHVPSSLDQETLVADLGSDPVVRRREVVNEFDASNGLSNTPRTLAAARTPDPDSASSQWFFNVTDNSQGFDPGPYTVFGSITEGWDWFQHIPSQALAVQVFSESFGPSDPFQTAPLVDVTPGDEEGPTWTLVVLAAMDQIPLVPGDFNLDGLVNAADEDVWAAAEGTNLWQGTSGEVFNLSADADGNAIVDMADHAIWEENLGEGALTPQVAGDYNSDGQVTAADYGFWHATYGQGTTLFADGNDDGTVDMADYTVWRDAFAAAGGAAGGAVTAPEPASGAICAALLALAGARRRRCEP